MALAVKKKEVGFKRGIVHSVEAAKLTGRNGETAIAQPGKKLDDLIGMIVELGRPLAEHLGKNAGSGPVS